MLGRLDISRAPSVFFNHLRLVRVMAPLLMRIKEDGLLTLAEADVLGDGGASAFSNTIAKGKEMNALTRWDPFKEMDNLQRRLSDIFGLSPLRHGDGREAMTVSEWSPLVDITEDDKEFLIKAELPEVKKEDVKVTVENGVLTITGQRKFEKEEKNKRYHRIERAYGSFARSFTLPDDADPSQVAAEFKEGLLTVRLAKSEHAKPKTIDVKVA